MAPAASVTRRPREGGLFGVLDFCSGRGGAARAACAEGFKAAELGFRRGESSHLLKPKNVRRVKQMNRNGEAIGACLAPPCVCFFHCSRSLTHGSRPAASSGPPRSAGPRTKKVDEGNARLRTALLIILRLNVFPWARGNPLTSGMRIPPQAQAIMTASQGPWRSP